MFSIFKIRFGWRPQESIRSLRFATGFDGYSVYVSSSTSLAPLRGGCRAPGPPQKALVVRAPEKLIGGVRR
eukprot:12891070-Prorocentrum_lima.AAC.1